MFFNQTKFSNFESSSICLSVCNGQMIRPIWKNEQGVKFEQIMFINTVVSLTFQDGFYLEWWILWFAYLNCTSNTVLS